jgi:hypothetical protein
MNGLALWIKSPLIRGHTVYGVRSGVNKKKHGKPEKIIYNTHLSLLNAPELAALDAARELERIFGERKYKKGTIHQQTIRPLSGLTFCGRCGAVCHIKTGYHKETIYRHFVCANHSQRQSKCGSRAKGSIYVAYDLVDRAVLEALQERGEDLANLVLSQAAMVEVEETPEIIALRGAIANLEALADEDLRGAIAKKTTALNRLIAEQSGQDDQSLVEAREMLVQYASVPEFWDIATDAEKKAIYRDFVGEVTVDGNDIRVTLLI